jgi:hypothetical protein
MRRPRLLPALACLALLASVQASSGQPPPRDSNSNPSHILLPDGIGDRNAAEELLAERLQRSRDLSTVQDVLKKIGANPKDFLGEDFLKNPKNLERAQKFAKAFGITSKSVDNPRLLDLMRKVKDKLSKEEREAVDRVVPLMKTSDSKEPIEGFQPPDPMPKDNERKPGTPAGGQPEGEKSRPQDNATPAKTPENPAAPTDEEKEDTASSSPLPLRRPERTSLFGEWLGELRGENGPVGELRNSLKDLLGPRTGLGNYTSNLSKDLRSQLPGLSDLQLGHFAREFGQLVPDTLKLRPREEDASSASLPDISSGLDVGLGTVVVSVALLAGAGLLVWALALRLRWGGDRDGWRLGRWPVQPSAVRTRGDVVKAFEYLALLLLGRKISTSHHLAIAGKLGTSQVDLTGRRQNAAEELAHLYEQARYAPPEEQLSEDDLATARRDLTFLAGGAAA